MAERVLIVGNRNYSSWSLRPWLVLKQAGIPFREHQLYLYTPEGDAELRRLAPSGTVPVLQDGDLTIWESLAICEYLAERHPDKQLWPKDPAARAVARSVANEMHAGFAPLRQHMSMNIRRRFPGKGRTPDVLKNIARIQALWSDCRQRFGKDGPFLFGQFSIADAMYAPVCLRFITYAVELDPVPAAYVKTMTELPAMREWIKAAETEAVVIEKYEIYG